MASTNAADYYDSKRTPSVTASPTAKVSFERPVPTYNRSSGWSMPATVQPLTSYVQPLQQQAYQPQPQTYNAPAQQNYPVGNYDFGGGGGGYAGANQPAAQSTPIMSDADWLAGDDTFISQKQQYQSALKSFLDRLQVQQNDFTQDYNTAVGAFNRNRDQGMLSLGEDFTARGLANSGLFANARNQANSRYEEQEAGMTEANRRGLAGFETQRADKRDSTNDAINNARLASLARKAASQQF